MNVKYLFIISVVVLAGCLASINAEFYSLFPDSEIKQRIKVLGNELSRIVKKKVKSKADKEEIAELREEIKQLREAL